KGKNLWTSRQGGTKIGYYEASDGENEALFVADSMVRYIREATNRGDDPRAAVLYRINSQSRLFEEAMRRYQLKYHVVGGFSFYERAEIKDLISYLKVIHNPDDSVSLLRVINTPVRGIGKTTMETVERVALETGISLWAAISESIERALLPQRALQALKSFRDLIEDARSMAAGTYAERLRQTTATESESDHLVADLGTGRVGTGALARTSGQSLDMSQSPTDETEFDPSAFDFGGGEHIQAQSSDASEEGADPANGESSDAPIDGFRSPGGPANIAEILKFLIDRTGYIKLLEQEDTPEAFSRVENIRELVNAAMDSKDRGETLDQFLDHAALVSDADAYDERAQITLMTLHAAKGLEFPLVFLCGLEEGLFPHSRTFLNPDDVEEERRLCYVGMTRAMDQLVLARAVYRRRYGTDMPEASVPSRFLDEIPAELMEELGRTGRAPSRATSAPTFSRGSSWSSGRNGRSSAPAAHRSEPHYAYEDEDQSASWQEKAAKSKTPGGPKYNSIDNIAEFFASRGKKFSVPKVPVEEPKGRRGFRPGQKVKHPKYGEGTVYQREGEGEEAKITVQFPRFGLKKLVEKYALLEKV
ncbi:MAG TPA: 3'-5' exonuclease, partial [Terriglobales bacterium]|nr:3'-5' exonuclease [Terriglobales bacterium]